MGNPAPFLRSHQLCHELERNETGTTAEDLNTIIHLPGHPDIRLQDTETLEQFLHREFCSKELDALAPHLWIMSTQSSANVNPLHHQKVKGRKIVVTESPRLHLVWFHNRVFIKPLPKYLLSHAFWALLADPSPLGDQAERILKAAKGFLRTYRHLIRHESDFMLAKQDHLQDHLPLIPQEVTWPGLCSLLNQIDQIDDSEVSERYHFGEIRLSRLNFYAPILLRKFYYEQVHGQYADYFARLYGPLLFIFAIISTVLNAMQVELAVDDVSAANWVAFWPICRWFSTISMVMTAAISLAVIFLWTWMICDEWLYATKCRWKKKRENRSSVTC